MITFQTNEAEFNRTLGECIKQSSRTIHQVILGHALEFLVYCIKLTPIANPAKIAWTLGQIGIGFGQTAKGKISKSKRKMFSVIKDDSFAARIVRAQDAKRGFRNTDESVHERAVAKIASRMRSVSFFRAGWIPAIKAVDKKINGRDTNKGSRFRPKIMGVPKGYGIIKQDPTGFFSDIEVANGAVPKYPKDQASAIKVIETGAIRAQRATMWQMKKHLQKKMQQDLSKFATVTTN